MISLLEKRPILTIIAVVGVLLLPFLDVLDVTIMEARNFITAREMLTDTNWILTTMNGEPRYEKPPLPTWITAISASIFGLKNVWGLRFPAVLMVMLLGSMVYMLSRKLQLSLRQSLFNGLISVTSLYVLLIVFEAPWDIYTHAFMLSGIYFVFRGLRNDTFTSSLILWTAAVLCIGASILSKGPVSLYVLFLPFLLAYIIVYRMETNGKQWLSLIASVLFALVLGFSWYAYVRYVDQDTFIRITTNETGNWSSYNVRPFYYYWSFFIQSGLWTIPAFISLLYPYLKSRVSHLKAYQFTLIWVLMAVVLLSVIPEKKSRYLMPVLIPLAINTGFYIEYLSRRFKAFQDWRESAPVYFNYGVIALCFCFLPISFLWLFVTDFDVWKIDFPPSAYICLGLLFIVGLWSFKTLIRKKVYRLIILSIIGVILPIYFYGTVQSVLVANNGYADFTYFNTLEKLPLYGLNDATPEMVWEFGDKIPRICKNNELHLPAEDEFYVLNFYFDTVELDNLSTNYSLEAITSIDLNTSTGNDKTERKRATVYRVLKKTNRDYVPF